MILVDLLVVHLRVWIGGFGFGVCVALREEGGAVGVVFAIRGRVGGWVVAEADVFLRVLPLCLRFDVACFLRVGEVFPEAFIVRAGEGVLCGAGGFAVELFGEVVVLVAELGEGVCVGGAGRERLDPFAEGLEGAGDLGVGGGVGVDGEGDCALALKEGEFDVVGEEEQLRGIRHCSEGSVTMLGLEVQLQEVYLMPAEGRRFLRVKGDLD